MVSASYFRIFILVALLNIGFASQHCLADTQTSECVILLHGMTRSASSMKKLEKALSGDGYKVVNVDYPSTEFDIPELAKQTIPSALKQCPAGSKVHFVTHSLGGILLRYYLSQTTIPNLSYSVMLGPPNNGSEVVDKLANVPFFFWLNGPAGLQLGTKETDIPKALGKANFDVGIIAGNRSINLILSALIPGDDDGKVSLKSAKLEGMLDFKIMAVSHPFIMKNRTVIKETLIFLKQGKFSTANTD